MYRYSKTQMYDFILPSMIFIGLAFLFHQTSLNEILAGQFYTLKAHWIYRDNFVLEKIFHKGGVLFTVAIIFAIFVRLLYICKNAEKKQQKNFLAFVLASTLLSISVIAILKRTSTLPCPWDSTIFGGTSLTLPIWKMFSSDFPNAQCFPAGHSSAGFSFLSFYYSYLLVYRKRNFMLLLPGLIIGIVFGITQQMRGAHFMSHDLATIFITIWMSWVTYSIYTLYNK